ncbi:hypothetical protein FMEAI12_5270030 [Parafrankia sp. Ea1.12]|nr:hypothetical protein FMEAI12_5270030 [Parafrankia sp. Ea1.12]
MMFCQTRPPRQAGRGHRQGYARSHRPQVDSSHSPRRIRVRTRIYSRGHRVRAPHCKRRCLFPRWDNSVAMLVWRRPALAAAALLVGGTVSVCCRGDQRWRPRGSWGW